MFGYANDGIEYGDGGPHRKINELALASFIEKAKDDPILSKYNFFPSNDAGATFGKWGLIGNTDESGWPFLIESMTVTQKGDWAEEDKIYITGTDVTLTNTKFKEGKAKEPFSWWLINGGMTADEPESPMALRHFYDPKNPSEPYLTDLTDNKISQDVTLMGENPEMNAIDWALSSSMGTKYAGTYSTGYSLSAGIKYFKNSETAEKMEDKQKYLGLSWRSFGETMHLLADMTVPAHVRNDGHPGYNIIATFKSDPYEDYVTSKIVQWYGQLEAEKRILEKISKTKEPKDLFESIALYTNENFFFTGYHLRGRPKITS